MLGARIISATGTKPVARKKHGISIQGLLDALKDAESCLSQTLLLLQCGLFVTALALESLLQAPTPAAISFFVVVLLGHALVRRAVLAAMGCRLSVHVLMFAVLLGALSIGDVKEAATVALVVGGSDWLVGRVNAAVEAALQRGLSSAVTHAQRLGPEGGAEEVRVEELRPGDTVLLRSGEVVPVDGRVRKSDGLAVDEASVTGEALPQAKDVGDAVLSGTVVATGTGEISCTAAVADSFQGRMQQAVEEARSSSSQAEELVDRLAAVYTPVVCIGATLMAVATLEPVRGLAALAGACPCALVAAAPIVQACVLVRLLGDLQVLVKHAKALENLSLINSLGVDKTGTLTEGHFEVADTAVLPAASPRGKDELFRLLAALESRDTHPLASSLVQMHTGCVANFEDAAGGSGLPTVTNFNRIESKGVWGVVDGIVVGAGSAKFLEAMDIDMPPEAETAREAWEAAGDAFTAVYMTIEEDVVMVVRMQDTVRPDAPAAVASLQKSGIEVVLLTGDSRLSAAAVAKRVGLSNFAASLAPSQKEAWVRSQQAGKQGMDSIPQDDPEAGLTASLLRKPDHPKRRGGRIVGMLGDGLNDSPALAAADVGIAVSCGLQLTVDAADIVVSNGGKVLQRLSESVEVSRRGRRLLLQNLILAFMVKMAALAMAALGHLSLSEGVLVDAVSLILVLLNGIRPLSWRLYSSVVP